MGVVGNNWLVGNAVFSETALRIFLIFLHQVRGLYRWKSQSQIFEKNLDLEIFAKRSPN